MEIESAINSLTDAGTKLTSGQARKIIEDICYKEERKDQAEREEAERLLSEKEDKRTLAKYIDMYVHKVYDFDDIDMKCYYDYTTFLKNKTKVVDGVQVFDGYSINSVGRKRKKM